MDTARPLSSVLPSREEADMGLTEKALFRAKVAVVVALVVTGASSPLWAPLVHREAANLDAVTRAYHRTLALSFVGSVAFTREEVEELGGLPRLRPSDDGMLRGDRVPGPRGQRDFLLESDPWGNSWCENEDGVHYSAGPNGIDEGLRGDDIFPDLWPFTGKREVLGRKKIYASVLCGAGVLLAWIFFVVARGPKTHSRRVAVEASRIALLASVPVVG
ncbi:MAG: hypothetical protein ACAI25_04215, partial [Planctomycetota bacterium]